jgi:hypothetical protein
MGKDRQRAAVYPKNVFLKGHEPRPGAYTETTSFPYSSHSFT